MAGRRLTLLAKLKLKSLTKSFETAYRCLATHAILVHFIP